jgi:hypothetical protein
MPMLDYFTDQTTCFVEKVIQKPPFLLNCRWIMANTKPIAGKEPIARAPVNAGPSKRMQLGSKRGQNSSNGFTFTDLMLFRQR